MEKNRSSFKGSIGFVLAAAGSAVGLGNIWRFPYLAAKDNGGFFILCYIILALTFGFTLLVTEIALGRKTKQSPLTAYSKINKNSSVQSWSGPPFRQEKIPEFGDAGSCVLFIFCLYLL